MTTPSYPVSLADLVVVATQAECLQLEIAVNTALGLSVTSWEPLDPSRTILQGNAEIISAYSSTVNLIAQGGFASYAAAMVDGNGNPITTWMDVLTPNLFNTIRFQNGTASGPIPVTNISATTYSYSPNNPIHFQYPTSGGATYTSIGTGTIPASSNSTVLVVADAAFPGSLGNAALGVVLQMATPLVGVTPTAITQPLIGSPQESNGALLLRSVNKLGTLSSSLNQLQQGITATTTSTQTSTGTSTSTTTAGGTPTPPPANPSAPTTAYDYVATSIAQSATGVASPSWPYYVTAPITRGQTVGNTNTGVVQQYVANAAGSPPNGDVAVVQAAVQALVTGQCITVVVSAAFPLDVLPAYTIYYRRGMGYTVAQAQQAILNAWLLYVSQLPIGGVQIPGTAGIMPFAEVEDVIYDALPGAVDLTLTLNGSNLDIVMGDGIVAVASTPSPANVVFV